jgi:signal transduction histidine kinase
VTSWERLKSSLEGTSRDGRVGLRTFIAFALVGFGFVASTLYTNWRLHGIHAQTEDLVANALPSVERLGHAAHIVRDLEGLVDEYPDLVAAGRAEVKARIEKRRADLDSELLRYAQIPTFPGERERYEAKVPEALRAHDRAVTRVLLAADGDDVARARQIVDRDMRSASANVEGLLLDLSEFDAQQAYAGAFRIANIRRDASRVAVVLDALCVLLGIIATAWVRRLQTAHTNLITAHTSVLKARADELEMFAKRVAHDLVSPLASLTYCLTPFAAASQEDPKLKKAIVAARGCVAQAQNLVTGVFEFARAGGRPDPDARADVGEVLEELTTDMQLGDSPHRAAITVDPFGPCQVACARGVLASVLSNLMGNAAAVVRERATREIHVRVREEGTMVRVEVQDSGPGLPPGLEEAIFAPYVRAPGTARPGLGLGLATVQRYCEAHGGRVGAFNADPLGAVFWFTLPRAPGR